MSQCASGVGITADFLSSIDEYIVLQQIIRERGDGPTPDELRHLKNLEVKIGNHMARGMVRRAHREC